VAITVDQATIGNGIASGVNGTLTTTAAVATGGMIALWIGRFNATTAVTVTPSGGGLTWTQAHQLLSGNLRGQVWYAPCPSGLASSTAITLTPSANVAGNDMQFGAMSLLGVDTGGTPVSAFNAAAASTAAFSSGTVAGAAGSGLVAGVFGDGLVGSVTFTGPAVESWDQNNAGQNETSAMGYKVTVAGSDSIVGSFSGAVAHVCVGVAFAPAAGAAASIPTLVMAPPIPA
jgi:hypothetical protein